MKKPTKKEVEEFLKESNAIEGVYDEQSFKDALSAWKFLVKHKKLTTGVVLKTHKILMRNQNQLGPATKGYYRRCPIYVGGREGLNWVKIHEIMEVWARLVANAMTEKDAIFHHVEYEKIHPFVDGNGRTGRMFYNWERLKIGLPIHIIHAGKEQMEYYKWFK